MWAASSHFLTTDPRSMAQSSFPLPGVDLLTRNTLWNFAGVLLPLAVAVAVMPWLINSLGTERFGMLTLAWVVLGYFGLFDLGLGRALTQIISARLSKGEDVQIAGIVWTASLLMLLLGVVGGVALFLTAHWLIYEILNVPETLRAESLIAIQFIAAGVPIVIPYLSLQNFSALFNLGCISPIFFLYPGNPGMVL